MRKITFALILLPFAAFTQTQESTDTVEAQMLNEVVVEGATLF